jgi:[acyl-carrier-protein] S-malonyltransferase
MKKAVVFPGQGSQYSGMGKQWYEQHTKAKNLYEQANEILGFRITDTMFSGSDEELKQTKITQPAVFLDSVIQALCREDFHADMVAGHSLGEFSALVASGVLSFEDGLRLVYERALSMQHACELNPSTMAAVLGLADHIVEDICHSVSEGVVVAANYNCPGQIVISGDIGAVTTACELLKTAGAKRALMLPVGGAFHSPLMLPAQERLALAIQNTLFHAPICPVYQNVTASPVTQPEEIKSNVLKQLTAPVKWTQTIQQMWLDGARIFTELGPGKVLQGLIKKICVDAEMAP